MISRAPRLPRIGCDDGEDSSFLEKIGVALARGAAPAIANYLLYKLDPSAFTGDELEVEPDADSDED